MRNLFCLSILLLFVSCSIKTHYLQTGSKMYPVTEAKNILIYSRVPEKPYEVIGSVAVWAIGEKQALNALKKKAAEIGADAIIEITLDKISSPSRSTGINGTAIKFK